MRRREVVALLGSGTLAWSQAGQAQQPAKVYRIAVLTLGAPLSDLTDAGRAFFGELRRLGYEEGQNLAIKRLSAEGHSERHALLVREAIEWEPDVIVQSAFVSCASLRTLTLPTPLWA